jgi:hypothetical protein
VNVQNGLKRIYVILAALWAIIWPIAFINDNGMPADAGGYIVVVGAVLSSPLIYIALVGITKLCVWVIAGFKPERDQEVK